jgi:hypothetical protein
MRWTNQIRPRRWGAEMLADVRYTARGLRRSPGFTADRRAHARAGDRRQLGRVQRGEHRAAGAAPYPQPERLVRIYHQNSGFDRGTLSAADWQGIREQQRSFESVALFRTGGAALTTREGAEWVR